MIESYSRANKGKIAKICRGIYFDNKTGSVGMNVLDLARVVI